MTRLRAWVQASRPLAQIFIAAPLLYGQALAYAQHGTFRFDILLLVLLFGIFDQAFVVFATAAADYRHEDEAHSRPSRRPPNRELLPPLSPMALAQGALSALLAAGGVSVVLALGERRAWMLVMTAMSAHLLWIYAFPPFRLATRGFGEWVGGLRLGLMLPAIGFYAQANTFTGFSIAFLLPSFLLGYAVLVTLAIPDAATDALAGKRTFAVRRGERSARRASLSLIAIAAVSTPLAVPRAGLATLLVVAPAVLLVLYRNFRLLSRPESELLPMRDAFVWRNGVAVALTLALWAVSAVILRGS
jgi:1,4-dihydroxy-2-naphthoate octaprenyltransferase